MEPTYSITGRFCVRTVLLSWSTRGVPGYIAAFKCILHPCTSLVCLCSLLEPRFWLGSVCIPAWPKPGTKRKALPREYQRCKYHYEAWHRRSIHDRPTSERVPQPLVREHGTVGRALRRRRAADDDLHELARQVRRVQAVLAAEEEPRRDLGDPRRAPANDYKIISAFGWSPRQEEPRV